VTLGQSLKAGIVTSFLIAAETKSILQLLLFINVIYFTGKTNMICFAYKQCGSRIMLSDVINTWKFSSLQTLYSSECELSYMSSQALILLGLVFNTIFPFSPSQSADVIFYFIYICIRISFRCMEYLS
jgi:hypothetical protein